MDCTSAKFLSYSGINKKLLDYSEKISPEDEVDPVPNSIT
jgi:hypothetical protein